MALSNLVEGECGAPNALMRLNTISTHDRALCEERRQGPMAMAAGGAESGTSQTTSGGRAMAARMSAPSSFRMDSLLQEMHRLQAPAAGVVPDTSTVFTGDVDHRLWTSQFAASHPPSHEHGTPLSDPQAIGSRLAMSKPAMVRNTGYAPHAKFSGNVMPGVPGMPHQFLYHYPLQHTSPIRASPADNPLDDVQWMPPDYVVSENDNFWNLPGANQNAAGIVSSAGRYIPQDGETAVRSQEHLSDVELQSGQSGGLHMTAAGETAPVPEHLEDSDQLSAEAREQLWSRLERQWSELYRSEHDSWLDTYHDPLQAEYEFATDNPHAEVTDPLSEGRRRLALGDLPGAVLCFEEAAHRQPDSAMAWQLLGQSLAENEQDPRAILALRKCIELDPANLPALASLAASYTNESHHRQACDALRSWLRHHPDYGHLVADEVGGDSASNMFKFSVVGSPAHERVMDEYLAAARLRANSCDVDVQCGLGTLLHMAGEYERAVDCFTAAVTAQPQNARLWNKLGATLANGNQPERAVSAYHSALALAPGFIRARFNLGITCRSLNANREAVEHFLSALEHQTRGRDSTGQHGSTQVISDNIWSTLRISLATMGRADLFPEVDNRNLSALCREFGMTGGSSELSQPVS